MYSESRIWNEDIHLKIDITFIEHCIMCINSKKLSIKYHQVLFHWKYLCCRDLNLLKAIQFFKFGSLVSSKQHKSISFFSKYVFKFFSLQTSCIYWCLSDSVSILEPNIEDQRDMLYSVWSNEIDEKNASDMQILAFG